jgi:hypothetical protein
VTLLSISYLGFRLFFGTKNDKGNVTTAPGRLRGKGVLKQRGLDDSLPYPLVPLCPLCPLLRVTVIMPVQCSSAEPV